MIREMLSALAASALFVASPALAEGATPLAVTPAAAEASELDEASALAGERGAAIYVLGAVVLALVIWGVWQLVDKEESESP